MEKEKEFNESASLEQMGDAQYPILSVLFNGTPVLVKIKELNQANIMACGDFSLIETLEDKIGLKSKNIKIRDIIAYAERNHAIVKEALVSPTYEQIFEMIGIDPSIKEKKKLIGELKKKITQLKPGPKRSAIEEELDTLRIRCNYFLPDDFISWIVAYTLKINRTDIKKITAKILLDSAILAKLGNDNPANHIDGDFTPFNKDDINRRAWIEHGKFLQENKKKVR